MDHELPDETCDQVELLQQLTAHLVKAPDDPETAFALITVVEQLTRLVLDNSQRALIGSNPNFSEAVARLWTIIEPNMKVDDTGVVIVHALARLTRNVAAECSHNQVWITNTCEPNIRKMVHFLTSFYNSQNIEYHLLTTLLAQCLVNMSTSNETTSTNIWQEYKGFTEQNNIVTRLLAYPERKTVTTTLVFILNSSISATKLSSVIARSVGGRATYVGLLEMVDQIYEDEERTDQFHIIFQIFVNLFESGGLDALYASLQPADGTVSPHQITLLKLLDGYTQTAEYSFDKILAISEFLTQALLSSLRTANAWMTATPADDHPNENLPQLTTSLVLVSQILAESLMSEQLAWEKSLNNDNRSRPILECLRSLERSYVELIIDVLRQLDQLLPRIQFGKVKPQPSTASAPTEPISLDVSGFQFVKRDLVRLLAILVHDDGGVQDRIREHGGVQVVLSLCAVDDRNPYIREHALFALRNLLYNNRENQDIVKELEPMGRWDENGVLTDLR